MPLRLGCSDGKACEQYDTKKLAKLLPGAHAVDSATLPAIVQLGNKPKLQMLEDCPHCMWWDEKQELLKDYEGEKDLEGFLDGMHFPLRARHFFKACAEGPCANGEMVETLRESRVAGSCAAPCAPRCSVRSSQSQSRCCRDKQKKKCLIRKV